MDLSPKKSIAMRRAAKLLAVVQKVANIEKKAVRVRNFMAKHNQNYNYERVIH